MMSTFSKSVRTYMLAPFFNFLISSFIPKGKNIASTKPQNSPTKNSGNPKVFENIRTFTLALHTFIPTISEAHTNVNSEMIKTLHRFKDALTDHLQLWHSLEQGVQTNASILKFIRNCCHDRHPCGLLKHQAEMAAISYLIIRATDKLLNSIYAYMIAKGEAP